MFSAAGWWAGVSKWGFGASLLYSAVGLFLIRDDYVHSSGGWINLKGLLTGLVVAPVSWPAEIFHWPFEPLNPFHAGAALLICAALIYTIVAGIEYFIRGLRAA